ncbi:hypothetical protein HOY80DRAFT_1100301 [Tuber brumale]|nr:hypothetical protein HOY80DRAFT_1100301 [Tuber brumale]
MKKQGLELQFSGNTNISKPEHYYRNDRWLEVRYTVEGKVRVVLQHYIQHGEIIQDMCLTLEFSEETKLSLEFEFTTGIRIAPGHMTQPKAGEEEDAAEHFIEPVPEGHAPGSHWKIRGGKCYATAILFKDGKPKSFSLREGDINILSDDLVRHHEASILKPNSRAKFTTVFKLDHQNVPNTLPQYFNISLDLESFGDRRWSFKTKSSSLILR